jgi:DNA replication licensing factor MCM5
LRKYITYCRQMFKPKLSEEAASLLKNHYVSIRNKAAGERGDSPIPITVRQLEAVIRISEALARLELAEEANASHVAEAIRLFKASTLNAVESGVSLEGAVTNEQKKLVQQAEEFIRSRVGIGMKISREGLKRQYMATQQSAGGRPGSADLKPFEMALYAMQGRQDVHFMNQGKIVHRMR